MKLAFRLFLVIVVAVPLGCRKPQAPAGTGAREAVKAYFDALAKDNWATAHAQLDDATQKRFDRAAFEPLAQTYCKNVGLPAAKMHIRSCDEQGDKAIAQINMMPGAVGGKHRYREGIVLQKEAAGWRITLPDNFGQPPR
jgi:hypothetical protein